MSTVEKTNFSFSRERTKSTKRNAILSISFQLVLFILTFATRSIFINLLGQEYLGINGLFSNVLSFLSLADLGINSVLLFALYKPISENDISKVKTLVLFSKKVYRIIAISIYLIGILVIPFLSYIVNGSSLPLQELKIYFFLYLLNTVFSYLVVYKSTLINADQNMHIIKFCDFISSFLVQIIQIVLLSYTRNYFLYLLVLVSFTLIKNIILSFIANKIYPFLKEKDVYPLSNIEKKSIFSNVKSIFLYRVSAMIMNSTDNILISIILGTLVVGYYSNYLLIVSAINTFIALLTQSIIASLGNFNSKKKPSEKLKIFRTLLLVFYFIGAVCSCCFLTMFNDFIYLWIGHNNNSYILSSFDVVAITFNFFISCVLNPVWMFRETTGQFKQVKYIMCLAALLNILLSIFLGYFLGLGGIIISTAISKLLTLFWFEPKKLFKNIFCHSVSKYWLWVFKLFLISLFCVCLCMIICYFIPCSWLFIFVKIFVCVFVSLLLFVLFNYKNEETRYLISKLKHRRKHE